MKIPINCLRTVKMELTTYKADNKKILYYLILGSLFFHVIFSFTYLNSTQSPLFSSEDKQEIVVNLQLQNNKTDSKQIVETEKSKIKEVTKSKFISEENNFFARETKSANNGSFKVAAKGERKAKDKINKAEALKHKVVRKENIKLSDLAMKPKVFERKKALKNKKSVQKIKQGLKNGKNGGVALGQTNDYLEDLPLGDFTQLNTQEYEFYGFYHRIREKLEQFWGRNIQEQADKIYKQGRTIASENNLITGLIIHLDSNGDIVEIVLKSTSGLEELDEAAIKSFNQAGPFPNPPAGMLQNGKATIEWGFVVNT